MRQWFVEQDLIESYQLGVNSYVRKPVTVEEVVNSPLVADPLRPYPACAARPSVRPYRDSWTMAEISCPSPPWTRLLRTGLARDPARDGMQAPKVPMISAVILKHSLAKGALIGKLGGAFVSTASQHGGQETTLTSIHTTLLHHGMIIVGLPYSHQGQMSLEEIVGGSPYGATTIAGDKGQRPPSTIELDGARHQGMLIARTANKLFAG